MTINKSDNSIVHVNILENRYITDSNIWTIDETIFNSTTKSFMFVNLKTRAILGYILHQEVLNEEIILKLYNKLLDRYNENKPIVIHSDMEPSFSSEKVVNFLKEEGIKKSTTLGSKNQNQVSEAINERIKALVRLDLVKKDSKALRNWRKNVPSNLKLLSNINKSRNKEFRRLLFESAFFQNKRLEAISMAISE